MTWKNLLLSGKGRVGRADFWTAWLLFAILGAVLKMFGPLVEMAGLLLLFYPQCCFFAKRLHDRGWSGWWTALIFGLVIAAAVALEVSRAPEWARPPAWATAEVQFTAAALGVLCEIVGLGLIFRIGLARGDPGENRYGAPPVSFLSSTSSRSA